MTVRAVAQWVGGSVEGDESLALAGIAPLDAAGPEHLSFADTRHAAAAAQSRAGALIAEPGVCANVPVIRVKDVQPAVAQVLAKLAGPEDLPPRGVHPSAVVAADARVAQDCAIGPRVVVASGASIGPRSVLAAGVCVGAGVTVGADTVLFEGVVVRRGCVIGSRVRVGPNSVIGFEGFGYYHQGGAHHRIPHAGNVVIEDDVELGACVCVDRAKFGSTRVGSGSKIDNLVQIAHNVQLGPGCLLAAQAGIAGSSKLGAFVVLGGASGVRDNISIGDQAQLAAFSAAAEDIPAKEIYAGTPAGPAMDVFRQVKAVQKLPDLLKRLRELEARLAALEQK